MNTTELKDDIFSYLDKKIKEHIEEKEAEENFSNFEYIRVDSTLPKITENAKNKLEFVLNLGYVLNSLKKKDKLDIKELNAYKDTFGLESFFTNKEIIKSLNTKTTNEPSKNNLNLVTKLISDRINDEKEEVTEIINSVAKKIKEHNIISMIRYILEKIHPVFVKRGIFKLLNEGMNDLENVDLDKKISIKLSITKDNQEATLKDAIVYVKNAYDTLTKFIWHLKVLSESQGNLDNQDEIESLRFVVNNLMNVVNIITSKESLIDVINEVDKSFPS